MMEKVGTLCLVDDDTLFHFLTRKVVERTHLVNQVITFINGLEAIRFLVSAKNDPEELPEIILLDLNMPVMDGWGFLDEYQLLRPKLNKKITLYVVSSSIVPDDIQRAKAISEVTDYIIKPVTRDKFMDILHQI